MNKKYIKRQLVLNNLGISVDSQIIDYYDYFNVLIGNKEDYVINESQPIITYRKNGYSILTYECGFSPRIINISSNIWTSFGKKFNIDNEKVGLLLLIFTNHKFIYNAEYVLPTVFYDDILKFT